VVLLFHRQPTIPPPPTPAWESEAWFLALPADQREEYLREHRAKHARFHALVAAEQRLGWIDALQMGVLFVAADIVSKHFDAITIAVALFLGAIVGFASCRLRVNEVATGGIALAAFIVFQMTTRKGLTPMQMFVFFPFGFAAAWLAWRRENRA
jgi:hypothetical protein